MKIVITFEQILIYIKVIAHYTRGATCGINFFFQHFMERLHDLIKCCNN